MAAKARLRLDGADPINNGLVGFWPLSQGAGRIAEDITPARRNGALTNVTDGWAASKFGKTIKLDGTNDYVTIPYSAVFDVTATNALTVSIWAAPIAVSASSYHGIMTKNRETGDISKMWGIWLTETGYWHFRGGNNTINSASQATLNVWTHLCITINGSGNFIVYINGASIGSAGVTLSGATSNVMIGTAGGVPEYFDGRLAGARIHNRVLGPSEVARLYRDPWAGTARPVRRVAYAPIAPITAEGAITFADMTIAGEATYTAPSAGGVHGVVRRRVRRQLWNDVPAELKPVVALAEEWADETPVQRAVDEALARYARLTARASVARRDRLIDEMKRAIVHAVERAAEADDEEALIALL